MQIVYLSRRNLLTLLAKLDCTRETTRTLIKRDTKHPKYPCSDEIQVTAVEDAEYYTERAPGPVHPEDAKTIQMKAIKHV